MQPGQVNRVPGKVPGEGLGGLVQSQVKFNRVPEKVLGGFGAEPFNRFRRSRVTRVPEKFPEKVPGSLGAEPSQFQQGSGEGSGEGVGFGAEPSQVQQGSRESFGEGVGGLVQSQVRFNRVPEKVPEKVQLRCFQRLASQHASERFVKIKCRGCWGYHRSLRRGDPFEDWRGGGN